MDDLSASLRAATENKITVKNAWKSTLIEHFSDLSSFESQSGINFQRATSALDGCVKVFSTRVDDVATATEKLLGLFSQEKSTKRKNVRKKEAFIESNHANINIRLKDDPRFSDPIFSGILCRSEYFFLSDTLELQSPSGKMLLYCEDGDGDCDDEIIVNSQKDEIEMKILPVSPGLRNVKENVYGSRELYWIEEEKGYADESDSENAATGHFPASVWENQEVLAVNDDFSVADHGSMLAESHRLPCNNTATDLDDGDGDGDSGVSEEDELGEKQLGKVEPVVFDETPFGYFRGWLGPSQWKMQGTKSESRPSKTERRKNRRSTYFLDFSTEAHSVSLFETGDVTMSKEAIVERRRKKNVLPSVLYFDTSDLYKFFICDGTFRTRRGNSNKGNIVSADHTHEETELEREKGSESVSEHALDCALSADFDNHSVSMIGERLETDVAAADDRIGERNPVMIRKIQIPKKVDVRKLKENMLECMKDKEEKASEIFKNATRKYTEQEGTEISPQQCFVALLFLANERNLELVKRGSDLVVNKGSDWNGGYNVQT